MSYSCLPSLQHMSAVKIATFLFKDDVIQSMIQEVESLLATGMNTFDRKRFQGWQRIREEAEGRLEKLLPSKFRGCVVHLLRAMHCQVHHWVQDHPFVNVYTSGNAHIPALCWRLDGRIDRLQTAKNFVGNECFYPLARFLMACTYFLEEDIPSVWDEVENYAVSRWDSNKVVRFWVNRLRGGVAHVPWTVTIREHFEISHILPSDTPMRVSIFFHLLSREKRKMYFRYLDDKFVHQDDLQSCLSLMDDEERTELFEAQPVKLLNAFLKFPYQDLFMGLANQLWPHMTVDRFEAVLYFFLRCYLLSGFEYFDFLSLFKEFWRASPDALKQEVMQMELRHAIESVLTYEQQANSLSLQEIVEKSLQNANSA